jgi:flagellar motor component MotA
MDLLIWLGIIILIIALLLGFSVMRGMIRMSFRVLKWVIIVLVALAIISIISGWLGWL